MAVSPSLHSPCPPLCGELGWAETKRTVVPPMERLPAGIAEVSMGKRLVFWSDIWVTEKSTLMPPLSERPELPSTL